MTTPDTAPAHRRAADPRPPHAATVVLTDTPVPSPRSRAASTATWVAMRGTGLLLSVLVLGHLLFVHILTDVSHTGASFVARRWSSALWVTWDGTMLTAALLHGAIGARTVIRDHTRRPFARRAWLTGTMTLILGLAGLGWYAIVATVLANQGH